ncbi:MAG: polyamine aminopropyltransferase [Firmicutes bacterium]|nr:polyamine aminopropyltransferase [Bacillota bacterium]
MTFWLIEDHTPGYSVKWRIHKTIYTEQTPYQHLAIVDTVEFGRALVLDGIIQTTVSDEFIYHEMIAHVPMFTHPNPRQILIVGGGDGGTAREVLKHPTVEKVDLVEIDERVITACRTYLPETASAFEDPRLNVIIDNGVNYVRQQKEKYDVLIVDSSDPVGPAIELFDKEFYRSVHHSLQEDGLFVAQTDSPHFSQQIFQRVYRDIKSIFPMVAVYLACIPSYISGYWSFTLGSKCYHPVQDCRVNSLIKTRYYTPELHRASFVLPRFIQELLGED